jgi:hypothetical protein
MKGPPGRSDNGNLQRDRRFESGSLQWRVGDEPGTRKRFHGPMPFGARPAWLVGRKARIGRFGQRECDRRFRGGAASARGYLVERGVRVTISRHGQYGPQPPAPYHLAAGGKWIRTIGSRVPVTPSTPPPNLRAKREVRAQRVSVISFSRGTAGRCWPLLHRTSEPAFTVGVAYYPDCEPRNLSGTQVERR